MELATWGAAAATATMTICWIASVLRSNASYVDRMWGPTVVVVGWAYLAATDDVSTRALITMVLATVWGVRLGAYLTVSGWGRGEEWRHREARLRHPRGFPVVSLFMYFWGQAVAAVAVSTPLLAVALDESAAGLRALDVVGMGMWAAGFCLETVADAQLRRFRQRARHGEILGSGLWRYSRHPNYFGDALMWWGLGVFGVAAGHWWALAGPAGMTAVLVLGSGVRAMDAHMRATRGAAFDEHVARTSAFIPLPPRRGPAGAATSAKPIRPL